jgi:hypothetical protein
MLAVDAIAETETVTKPTETDGIGTDSLDDPIASAETVSAPTLTVGAGTA